MKVKDFARLTGCWRQQCSQSNPKPCWLRRETTRAAGLDIYGFFLSEVGLGQTARLYHSAAQSAGFSVSAINRVLPDRQNDQSFARIVEKNGAHGAALSIDSLIRFGRIAKRICRRKFNIGMPLWELEEIPAKYHRPFRELDKIIAPSSYIKHSMETALGVEVDLVKHPIVLPDLAPIERHDGDVLKVFYLLDFDSFPARKNPEGVVNAFQRAFPGKRDVRLTVKTRGTRDGGRRKWLTEKAAQDERITLIDSTLSHDDVVLLIRGHDVFLSLHRSEGFGLGCAEALALEKIVIATDYGGSTDFVNEQTGFPVEWSRREVQPGEYVDIGRASWADPSVEHASALLQAVYDSPKAAQMRAEFGRAELARNHSIESVGQSLREVFERAGLPIAEPIA